MERFCSQCGTLVSGDGTFCPQCGAAMESAVNLNKPTQPADVMPSASMPTAQAAPVQTAQPAGYSSTYSNSTNTAAMPNYPQAANVTPAFSNNSEVLTLGDWMFILLVPGLVGAFTGGIGQLIFYIVWAVSSNIPQTKKNYARAMLILYAISLVLCILIFVIMFAVIGVSMTEILSSSYYY